MAYQRVSDSAKGDVNVKVLGDSLDSFVSNAITLYKNQITVRDNEDENRFQSLVLAGDMPLGDQLKYRQAQLGRTQDPDTRANIRSEISSLKDRVEQKNFSDNYTKQLQDHAAGIESVDTIVSWLKDQLANTTDTAVKDKINQELVTQENNQFTAVQNMLKDQTNFALNDKSDKVVSDQIDKLQSARSQALLSGDKDTAANLDLQLQSLQKAKAENSITRDMQNMAVATVSGASNATNLLDAYNSKIASSDINTPITVNGVTYANAQQFWTYTRDSYLADQGSSGFFGRLSSENKDAINVKGSSNSLNVSDLATLNSQFSALAARPDLANYAAQMAVAKQASLQNGSDQIATVIENKYTNDEDLNSAVTALQNLKSQGVNVDASMQKILNSASTLKANNVQNIISAAQELMSSNPGMSITDAVSQAIKSGAGVVLSPHDLLSQSPSAIATDQITKTTNKTQPEDTKTTIQPDAKAIAPANIDYSLHPGETIDAYNARIAQARAQSAASSGPAQGNNVSAPTAASSPTNASPLAPTATTPTIDYSLHPGETIDAYNARIAAARGSTAPAPTTPVVPPPTPTVPAPTSPSPAPAPTSSSSTAAQTLRSTDPYNPPSGLTQTKTAGGGTGYADGGGNIYVQSSPGIYTLQPK